MLFRLPTEVLILLIPSLLFALCFHEFAHAYMAYRLGDDTAARHGRLTINPMAHIDPFGALMILFVGFGWAKPVPVEPRKLRNPHLDLMKIAFAGPASNLALALVGGLFIRSLGYSTYYEVITSGVIGQLLIYFIQINIMLAVFNMIPIPPLDGSRIFSGLMIKSHPKLVYQLNRYGPNILIGLIMLSYLGGISIFGIIITPFLEIFMSLFAGISI